MPKRDLACRMAEAFYEKGREMDGRTFRWDQLSETTRQHYRDRMSAALEVQDAEGT